MWYPIVTLNCLQVEAALPPAQIRYKGNLISDLEAIDKSQMMAQTPDLKKAVRLAQKGRISHTPPKKRLLDLTWWQCSLILQAIGAAIDYHRASPLFTNYIENVGHTRGCPWIFAHFFVDCFLL